MQEMRFEKAMSLRGARIVAICISSKVFNFTNTLHFMIHNTDHHVDLRSPRDDI